MEFHDPWLPDPARRRAVPPPAVQVGIETGLVNAGLEDRTRLVDDVILCGMDSRSNVQAVGAFARQVDRVEQVVVFRLENCPTTACIK